MTEITSKEAALGADVATVFAFLCDMNNYELLLPKDKINDWESGKDHFSCKIQNTYKISLLANGTTDDNEVHLVSAKGSPLNFSLNLKLKENGDGSKAQMFCDADLNPFLKMMALKPLQNLFDYMAGRLEKIYPVE
jgi:carbon monoxide dehydrogenase subunit G